MEDKNKIPYFDVLPYELNAKIVSYLDPRAMNNLAETYRFWRSSIANLDKRRISIVINKLIDINKSEQANLTNVVSSWTMALASAGVILSCISVFTLSIPLMLVGASMATLGIIALLVESLSSYLSKPLYALTSPNHKHLSFF